MWTVGYSVGSALLPIQWEDDEEEEEESSLPPLHQKERSTSIAFYVQVGIPTLHCTLYTVELVFACVYFITVFWIRIQMDPQMIVLLRIQYE